ncbi:unnamed protein product [Laminaria digitata]
MDRCSHGGHANHLSDWFANQNECGVRGCRCKCRSVDAPAVPCFSSHL